MSNLPLTVPDLVCLDDLDKNANETTSDLQTLAQDIFHELIELPHSNPDDPDGGIGADQYLSGTEDQIQALPNIIENVLGRDDRIDAVTAAVVDAPPGSGLDKIVTVKVQAGANVLGLQYGWIQGQALAPLNPIIP